MDPMYDLHSWSKQRREGGDQGSAEALAGQSGKRRSQNAIQTGWSRLRLKWRPEPAQIAAR
jgi:hypothetical protein